MHTTVHLLGSLSILLLILLIHELESNFMEGFYIIPELSTMLYYFLIE